MFAPKLPAQTCRIPYLIYPHLFRESPFFFFFCFTVVGLDGTVVSTLLPPHLRSVTIIQKSPTNDDIESETETRAGGKRAEIANFRPAPPQIDSWRQRKARCRFYLCIGALIHRCVCVGREGNKGGTAAKHATLMTDGAADYRYGNQQQWNQTVSSWGETYAGINVS